MGRRFTIMWWWRGVLEFFMFYYVCCLIYNFHAYHWRWFVRRKWKGILWNDFLKKIENFCIFLRDFVHKCWIKTAQKEFFPLIHKLKWLMNFSESMKNWNKKQNWWKLRMEFWAKVFFSSAEEKAERLLSQWLRFCFRRRKTNVERARNEQKIIFMEILDFFDIIWIGL